MSVITPHDLQTQILQDMEAQANRKAFMARLSRACHRNYLRERFMRENGVTEKDLRPDRRKKNRRGRR